MTDSTSNAYEEIKKPEYLIKLATSNRNKFIGVTIFGVICLLASITSIAGLAHPHDNPAALQFLYDTMQQKALLGIAISCGIIGVGATAYGSYEIHKALGHIIRNKAKLSSAKSSP